MELIEAIKARHSVRKYLHKHISEEAIAALQEEIDECNRLGNLHIQLVLNEPKAFDGIASYGKFKGVENYLIIAGEKATDLDERVGYYGERVVLKAQCLGLNTCWTGLTYKKVHSAFTLNDGEKVVCAIALGYGETQGVNRKSKLIDVVSNADSNSPEWFKQGVEAVLLAPTAINQQKFYFKLTNETSECGKAIVEAKRLFSLVGYTKMDLGIAKLHFEIAAGKENFVWKSAKVIKYLDKDKF